MATGAVLDRRIDVQFLNQRRADFALCLASRWLPIEICDLRNRTHEACRVAVAVQTPRHRMRLSVVDDLHLIHLPVAAHAAHASVYMHRVMEIRIVGGLVDLHPLDGFAGLPRIPHQLEFRILALDLRMAVHADLSGRDVRIRRSLDVRMAIAAIHPQLSGMDLVGKRDRLSRFVTDPRVFRGKIIPNP